MEEDLDSSIEEVAPQDHESEAIETSESPEETSVAKESHDSEDNQERNWREIRRKQREAEIREKAKDELIEKLLQAKQAAPVQQAIEPDEFENIAPEDYPTWGQTDKRIQKKAEAIADEVYRKREAEREQSRFLERLQTRYSDFSDVVNSDSIALLEEKDPELATTIAELKDPYKIGMQTYKYLKAMNLSEQVPGRRHAKEVERKIEKNEKSVQSPQAYNKRPMAQAFQMSESEKTKLYEEMTGYARGASFGY